MFFGYFFMNEINVSPIKSKIPASVWAIGIASFLINVSSAIVFGLSAVYMKTSLGVATGWIGLLEGLVEGCSYVIKLFSGVFSDFLRRRKMIMLFGFGLATLARPLLAISSTAIAVVAARLFDRIGNGMQATPRDALVGDVAPEDIKGACYGLRQSLATAGSFFGGLLAVGAMVWTASDFHSVFWIAAIPSGLACVILAVFVKDSKKLTQVDDGGKSPLPRAKEKYHKIHFSDIPRLGKAYWFLMSVVAIFMLARVSEAMLILHAHQNFGLAERYTPLILIIYNGANAIASYPVGRLSDFTDRRLILGVGFLVLILADLLLGFASNIWVMLAGVAVWGVQIGMTQSMFMALIADNVPDDLRGTGFGFYYLISAVSLILASTIGGFIAEHFGESMTFIVSCGIGCVSLLMLMLMVRKRPISA